MIDSEKKYKFALALGSNLGIPIVNLDLAITTLGCSGVTDIKCSSLFKTAPVACKPGTPHFTNMALTGIWQNSAQELLQLCQKIEFDSGRPKVHAQDEARIIDLDILIFSDQVINEENLIVPHPRMHLRGFVLEPLAEIAPNWLIPTKGTVKEELLKYRDLLN